MGGEDIKKTILTTHVYDEVEAYDLKLFLILNHKVYITFYRKSKKILQQKYATLHCNDLIHDYVICIK